MTDHLGEAAISSPAEAGLEVEVAEEFKLKCEEFHAASS